MQKAYAILMRMKGGLQPKRGGYTIVEVLIVLAVSGLLFVSTAFFISGRQRNTEFDQAVHEIQSQIQQIINEVQIGYYPNRGTFSCTSSAGGPVLTTAGAKGQGANDGCIFLGKAIQIGVGGTSPEEMNVFSIAGTQKDASNHEVTTYPAAHPTIIGRGATPPANMPDVTTKVALQYGLKNAWAKYVDQYGSTYDVGTVAFMTNLASYNAGGSLVSGSQQINLVPVGATWRTQTTTQAIDAANTNMQWSTVNPTSGVSVCYVSGGTSDSGLITIGGNGRDLAVTLKIYKGNTSCGA